MAWHELDAVHAEIGRMIRSGTREQMVAAATALGFDPSKGCVMSQEWHAAHLRGRAADYIYACLRRRADSACGPGTWYAFAIRAWAPRCERDQVRLMSVLREIAGTMSSCGMRDPGMTPDEAADEACGIRIR